MHTYHSPEAGALIKVNEVAHFWDPTEPLQHKLHCVYTGGRTFHGFSVCYTMVLAPHACNQGERVLPRERRGKCDHAVDERTSLAC